MRWAGASARPDFTGVRSRNDVHRTVRRQWRAQAFHDQQPTRSATSASLDEHIGRLFAVIGAARPCAISTWPTSTSRRPEALTFVGTLAGENRGTISNVHRASSGIVSGGSQTGVGAGGLVGQNSGVIASSSSAATVSVGDSNSTTASNIAGGLVATNLGTITGSSASGNVSGGAFSRSAGWWARTSSTSARDRSHRRSRAAMSPSAPRASRAAWPERATARSWPARRPVLSPAAATACSADSSARFSFAKRPRRDSANSTASRRGHQHRAEQHRRRLRRPDERHHPELDRIRSGQRHQRAAISAGSSASISA